MSYVYRCGCVGHEHPVCPIHRVNHIIQSSASPTDATQKDVYSDDGLRVIHSNKKLNTNKKFDLIFFPSLVGRELEEFLIEPDRTHAYLHSRFNEKHIGVIYCEYDDYAANLLSLYALGYEDDQLLIMTSLRAYDVRHSSTHEEFRGIVIMFGTHDLDSLPKSFIYLGSRCLYEKHFMNRDWVKSVLDYDSTSFRTYIGFKEMRSGGNKKTTLTIKTEYIEIFNMIKSGAVDSDTLRCIVDG